MKFSEAMKLLEEGKKVRNTIWPSGSWICKTENGDMTGETNNTFLLANINGNWEEYIEPTDNTTEKIRNLGKLDWVTNNEKEKLQQLFEKLDEVINYINK